MQIQLEGRASSDSSWADFHFPDNESRSDDRSRSKEDDEDGRDPDDVGLVDESCVRRFAGDSGAAAKKYDSRGSSVHTEGDHSYMLRMSRSDGGLGQGDGADGQAGAAGCAKETGGRGEVTKTSLPDVGCSSVRGAAANAALLAICEPRESNAPSDVIDEWKIGDAEGAAAQRQLIDQHSVALQHRRPDLSFSRSSVSDQLRGLTLLRSGASEGLRACGNGGNTNLVENFLTHEDAASNASGCGGVHSPLGQARNNQSRTFVPREDTGTLQDYTAIKQLRRHLQDELGIDKVAAVCR